VSQPRAPANPDGPFDFALWTWRAGDTAGARDLFATLLPVIERVSGSEDPDALAARFNLAYSTGEAGDAAGARDQYAALLPVEERVLGPKHATPRMCGTTSPTGPEGLAKAGVN